MYLTRNAFRCLRWVIAYRRFDDNEEDDPEGDDYEVYPAPFNTQSMSDEDVVNRPVQWEEIFDNLKGEFEKDVEECVNKKFELDPAALKRKHFAHFWCLDEEERQDRAHQALNDREYDPAIWENRANTERWLHKQVKKARERKFDWLYNTHRGDPMAGINALLMAAE